MNKHDEVMNTFTALDDEQRSLLLDFARLLHARAHGGLPDDLSPDSADYRAWRAQIDRRAEEILASVSERLTGLGIPADGDLPRSNWPADMESVSLMKGVL